MQYNSHALGIELIDGLTCYPRPEIYTYTFPQHAIFSGTCDGSGLKYYYPDMENPRREDTLNRVFLMGYRFDLLVHVSDRNAPFSQYLRRLVALRQQVKADLYASDFRDEIGLGPLPEKVYAKLFRRQDGQSLTLNLVDRRSGEKAPFELTIDLGQHEFSSPVPPPCTRSTRAHLARCARQPRETGYADSGADGRTRGDCYPAGAGQRAIGFCRAH